MQPLRLPVFRDFAVEVKTPGEPITEATRILGQYLREVMKCNLDTSNFRVFGPDETASNRLEALYEVTGKTWEAATLPVDENLATDGRVMEILSEHCCQGWLEGYLLTGRHGLFSCYEAFIHIIDSMFNQHAKWLKTTREIPWRKPIASLNYLLTSHVWRQDHNGFSHQDPGFIDHVANKKAEIVRIYLPPDTNCLLSVADHCLRSRNYINVIVAGKQPAQNWLNIDDAVTHCTTGMGTWHFASNDDGNPEVVMACAGDVPTLEILAAVSLLREELPDLRIRVVNVVDLMALQPTSEHPHGLTDEDFDSLFTKDKPVIFAFHGYPDADPPPDLSPPQSQQHPRPRLRRRGHHDNSVRHGRPQSHGPLPSRARRDQPRPAPPRHRRQSHPALHRADAAPQTLRLRKRRRPPRSPQLEMDPALISAVVIPSAARDLLFLRSATVREGTNFRTIPIVIVRAKPGTKSARMASSVQPDSLIEAGRKR